MTTKLVTLDFNDGQIIKSALPNDRKEKILPSVVGLTTIGYELKAIWEMPAKMGDARTGP